jgi:hypothetical protein
VNAEGRERFFRAIAERIDVKRVEEVHVFPAIRQGGRESGVAVLTLLPEPTESELAAEAEAAEDALDQGDDGSSASADAGEGLEAMVDGEYASYAPDADSSEKEEDDGDIVDAGGDVIRADADVDADGDFDVGEEPVESPLPPPPPRRFTVLRAHYRLQLKGPDRGKWEVAVVEEADAPSATVDEVVRGVHERAGGWSVEGPERLTGDEFRAALVEEPWSATR